MRILVIGAGGVGSAFVPIALRRSFFEHIVIADYDLGRADAAVARAADPRVSAAQVDASKADAVAALIREQRITHVLNAVDPRFVMPIFEGCAAADVTYLDMAMSLSRPHPDEPHALTGLKLGDEQFAQAGAWEAAGRLALVGIGVEPGLSDIFARYAADHLFSEIDEIGVRDGANLTVDGYDFAPSFSIWTTIEECLNPPVIWDDGRWYTTPPFSEPEVFEFPGGDRPGRVRERGARRGPPRPALGEGQARDVQVRPRRRVHRRPEDHPQARAWTGPRRSASAGWRSRRATSSRRACRTRPPSATGCTARPAPGPGSPGEGWTGARGEVYLYHVVDNDWSMREYGSQAVVWQTAVNAVVGLELLARGTWSGTGVLGPEAFDAVPFLDLLVEYGSPWGMREGRAG